MMKNSGTGHVFGILKSIAALFLFWLIVFFIQRQVFLLYNLDGLRSAGLLHILLSNWFALRMDIAAACYLMFFPVIVLLSGLFFDHQKVFFRVADIINYVLIVLCVVIGLADTGISANWGTKITARALSFFAYPAETFSLLLSWNGLIFFISLLLLSVFFIFLYRKRFRIKNAFSISRITAALLLILIPGLMFVGIRGGFGRHPIGRGSPYYSVYPVLNSAALNSCWNLLDILFRDAGNENPYVMTVPDSASEMVHSIYNIHCEGELRILNSGRPNIVLIFLESVGADAVAAFGGEMGLCPVLDSLSANGLIFSDIYATGFRTDQGFVAVFSGFPAQPLNSVIRDFGRFEALPNMIKELNATGYHTSFFMGGNLDYGNTRSYLLSAGTDLLMDEGDMNIQKRTDWGAYDEELFAFHAGHFPELPQPFFTSLITITNHEDFDADVVQYYNGNGPADKYRNTVRYTDGCIGKYLSLLNAIPAYSNTLFVITGDHAHKYPAMRAYNEPARHHVPLILFGPALKKEFCGKRITRTGSHTDIAITLLSQLGLNTGSFHWGRNLLDSCSAPGQAFYTFDHGYGFVRNGVYAVYDYNLKEVVMQQGSPDEVRRARETGGAIMQMMFSEYLELGSYRSE